jgi:hypothetical protein
MTQQATPEKTSKGSIQSLHEESNTFYYKVRESLMLQLWRVEQARSIIALLFWSLALTGIFYERVAHNFNKCFGLDPEDDAMVITLALTIIVMVGIVLFGSIYDITFRMWEFKSKISGDKDIFRQGKMNDKEIAMYEDLWYPLTKAINNLDPEKKLDPTVQVMKRWLENHEVVAYEGQKTKDEHSTPAPLKEVSP